MWVHDGHDHTEHGGQQRGQQLQPHPLAPLRLGGDREPPLPLGPLQAGRPVVGEPAVRQRVEVGVRRLGGPDDQDGVSTGEGGSFRPLPGHAHRLPAQPHVSGVAAAARHRIEVQQQDAVMAKIESDLATAVARLAPGRALGELLSIIPSAADRVALDDHLIQVSRLGERLDGYRQRAEMLDQALRPDIDQPTVLVDQAVMQRLAAAVRTGQSLGDVVRRTTDADRQLRELDRKLEQALSDLGVVSDSALRRTQPVLEAQITLTKQNLAELDEQLKKMRDEQQLVGRDLDSQQLRQRQLAAEGEVVTAETLRRARSRRDEGWALIRSAYIEQTQNAADLAHAFDPAKPLPEAFEATMSEADRQADLLRADAKRAAGLEECSVRIAQMDARSERDRP